MTRVEMWNPWKPFIFNGLRVEADSTAWKANVFNGLAKANVFNSLARTLAGFAGVEWSTHGGVWRSLSS